MLINRLLSWMVYVILFFMGISLAFMEDLSSNLVLIFQYSAVFFFCILCANLLLLALLERRMPRAAAINRKAAIARAHGAGVARCAAWCSAASCSA